MPENADYHDKLSDWFLTKEDIHQRTKQIFFRERQIWTCHLGVNIGHEQNGGGENHVRPVLVLKKLSPSTALVVPLTTSDKNSRFRCKVGKNSFLLFDQIRVIDVRRFRYLKQTIPSEKFTEIKQNFLEILQ